MDLNLRQRRVLLLLNVSAGIYRREYEAQMSCSARTAKRDLSALRRAGRLRLLGRSTASYYVLAGQS